MIPKTALCHCVFLQARTVWFTGLLAGVFWLSWPGTSSQPASGAPAAMPLPADLDAVPRDAAGFISIRVADFWNAQYMKKVRERMEKAPHPFLKDLQEKAGLSPADIERWTMFVGDFHGSEPLVLVATVKPYDRGKLRKLLPNAREKREKGQVYHVSGDGRLALHLLNDRVFLFGDLQDVKKFLAQRAAGKNARLRTELAEAAKKHLFVVGIRGDKVSAAVRADVPKDLQPLLRAGSGMLVCDGGEPVHAEIVLPFDREADAEAGAKAVRAGLSVARKGLQMVLHELRGREKIAFAEPLRRAMAALEEARCDRNENVVRVSVQARVDQHALAAAFVDAVLRDRRPLVQAASANNLKEMGIAVHNYYDTHRSYPPHAIYGKDGQPLLSWRVVLLPYFRDKKLAELYQELHLNEPWDSEHNKKFLARMPALYAASNGKRVGDRETFYRGFVGEEAFFRGKKVTRLADVPDGLSQTIVVVEAAESMPWTKPDDLPFDSKKPLPRLGGIFPKGFHALFADGHVAFLPLTIHPVFLKRLITRAEGVRPEAGGIPAVDY